MVIWNIHNLRCLYRIQNLFSYRNYINNFVTGDGGFLMEKVLDPEERVVFIVSDDYYLKIYSLSTKKLLKTHKDVSNFNPDQLHLKGNKLVVKNIQNVFSVYLVNFLVENNLRPSNLSIYSISGSLLR